ncbi:MAG: tRNA (adenosine(37)-N6)-threonylcarbamoyltransferase complex ATPase subunit type 1 TsaE [Mariniphaga sp.]|nr:tRNA (adenosine(37)-N6)-threonylcarbamoyltransferase complex ATPase subunit type 1 TsaE [Mariniphaga sp.]MDD4227439.1 tRNA (adenosine(37)-N6)-threonylcarbamoyltransferase complex ATPase subunit type 1 TsaE [Mariniphaga sp.]MDD4426603.1 tRNA (adenosine(37)-N6)-threonylcarbamoyltransferase complex ATPase subunit type 1 TsaE [Mariniphaga sp.]
MAYSAKVNTIDTLDRVAKELVEQFSSQRIFAFYGKMGAGKTTFIQALCRILGSTDRVTSPTFAIINEYNSGDGSSIYHFDFYRIKDMEEAFDLGYEDYFYSGCYCLIEWPEKIEQLLPQHYVEVKIDVLADEGRNFTARVV